MRFLITSLLFCLPAAASAAAYKCVEDGRTVYSAEPCGKTAVQISTPKSSSGESIILQRQPNGMFAGQGTINGYPMHFVVDTGATQVAVPHNLASLAGISGCQRDGYLNTANGKTENCVATANVTFGAFRADNLQVSVMLNTPDGVVLLGANFLKRFSVIQEGDTMQLIRR